MPDSFGRVESHCFGCESTFASPRAQTVAERVFATLVAKNPNKPQTHYLLGYLREQQGRGKEAIPHFRRAIELDADYLNAWKRLEELSREYRVSAAERDAIAFNLLRLDPLGRHASANLGEVTDLRQLWGAVDVASKFRVKPPATLLALPASRAYLDKEGQQERAAADAFSDFHLDYVSESETPSSPGQALAHHPLIKAISGLLETR